MSDLGNGGLVNGSGGAQMNDRALSPEDKTAIEYNFQMIATQLGISISAAATAAVLELSEHEYTAYTQAIIAENKAAAAALQKQSAVASLVDGIAAVGSRVLTMGDSITTCRYSYAELLRQLLEPRGVSLFNWGVGGYTSNHALELCFNVKLRDFQADVIFLCYGVNDAKYFGSANKMLVSHGEYTANMTAAINALQHNTSALPVLITPTPVVESIANQLPPGFHQNMRWENADIKKMGAALHDIGRAHNVPVIDMFGAFGDSPSAALYLEDGLHPNRAGQRLILEHIAKHLKFH